MLEGYKRNLMSKKAIAMLIFGVIILSFVLSGVFGRSSAGTGGAAAVINSQIITMNDLEQKMREIEEQYKQMFGGKSNFTPERKLLINQALQQLISAEIAFQISEKMGLVSTDTEIRDFITKIPAFQKDGRFQKNYYNNYLEATRLTPKEFEDRIRKGMNTSRMQNLFELASHPTVLEVQKNKDLKAIQQNYRFIKFNTSDLAKNTKVSDEEIARQLADKNFMDKLTAYFTQNKAQYSNAEEVKASHILLKISEKNTDEDVLARISQLKKEATPENFASLVKKNSEDVASKEKAGDLGYFSRGAMIPEFEEAAFAAKTGEIVGPVKSQFGYHLIYVTGKKAAHEAQLEEVKKEIAHRLLGEDAVSRWLEQAETLLKEKKYAEFEASLKTQGLKWEETGFVSLDQEAISKISSQQAAEVMGTLNAANPYSSVIRDGSDRYFVQWKDQKVEATKEEGAVADVSKQLAQQKSYGLLNGLLMQFREKAQIEQSPQLQIQ